MAEKEPGKRRKYDHEERLVDFAVRMMNPVESLPKSRVGNHVAGQLLRCGTSPAFNYGEAQSAESKSDFVHKMKACLKELRETRIGLLVTQRKKLLPARKLTSILSECVELVRIFSSSVRAAEASRRKARRPSAK